MNKPNKDKSHYNDFYSWLEDTKNHEITHVVKLVENAKEWVKSAEKIPEEKCIQFIDNFKVDLLEFYQQSQVDFQHSLYAKILSETFWSNIAGITDRSQLEWIELSQDIKQDGLYKTGDYVGFGEVECLSCGNIEPIYHLTELSCCIKCDKGTFKRKSLMP